MLEVRALSQIIKDVRENGFSVLESYLQGEELETLKNACLRELKTSNDKYSFGDNRKYFGNYPDDIAGFFKDELMESFREEWKCKTTSLYITHEYKQGTLPRNAYLHFDEQHHLKFFFYLVDVDENCGPLTVCPKSHKKSEEIRQGSWSENKIEVGYPGIANDYEQIPIVGPAGSLIIFDTNCWHKGGQVEPDHERLIVRSHCRL